MFQWLSPSFPTGSFNFSQGLEYAVSQYMVKNETDLVVWIEYNLDHGILRNDAIFLNLAYKISTDKETAGPPLQKITVCAMAKHLAIPSQEDSSESS